MEAPATVYRCKQCSATVRQADQRQAHLHWHGVSDKNVDARFDEVEEELTVVAAGASQASAAKKSGPSVAALIISLGVLAVIGVMYVMAK